MLRIKRSAPAKINLTLSVMPRRPDGFHDLESLVARIDLCDDITFTKRKDDAVQLTCDDPAIPADESNLVIRAARLLADKFPDAASGLDIDLKKRIPAGAGLGGGSSDAAAALRALNELWNLNLTSPRLAELAAQLGSDVPLFFHSPLCIIRGRGEIVQNLKHQLTGCALLIIPQIHSSTPTVYRAFDQSPPPQSHADPIGTLNQAVDCPSLMPLLYNDLETSAFNVNPALADLSERLNQIADSPVRMTGSGSAFFSLFNDQNAAEDYAQIITSARIPHAFSTQLVRIQTLV